MSVDRQRIHTSIGITEDGAEAALILTDTVLGRQITAYYDRPHVDRLIRDLEDVRRRLGRGTPHDLSDRPRNYPTGPGRAPWRPPRPGEDRTGA